MRTLLLALLVAFGLCAGCRSADKKEAPPPSGNLTGASNEPAWVSDPYALYEGDRGQYRVGVGSHKSALLQHSRDVATANARREVANQLQTMVQGMVTTYTQSAMDANDPSTASAIENSEVVSRLITKQLLEGTVPAKYWKSPDGEVFVLLVLDYDQLLAGYKDQMAKIMAERFKEESSAQRQKALDALDEQLDKMKGKGFGD